MPAENPEGETPEVWLEKLRALPSGAAGGGGVKVEEALAAAEQRLSKLQRSYAPSTFCRSKDAT